MKPRPSVRSECGEEDERSSERLEARWGNFRAGTVFVELQSRAGDDLICRITAGPPRFATRVAVWEATQSAWPVQTSQPQFSDTVLTPSRTCTVQQTARTRSTCASRIDTSCRPAVVSDAFEGGRGTKRNRLTRGHSLWPSR